MTTPFARVGKSPSLYPRGPLERKFRASLPGSTITGERERERERVILQHFYHYPITYTLALETVYNLCRAIVQQRGGGGHKVSKGFFPQLLLLVIRTTQVFYNPLRPPGGSQVVKTLVMKEWIQFLSRGTSVSVTPRKIFTSNHSSGLQRWKMAIFRGSSSPDLDK